MNHFPEIGTIKCGVIYAIIGGVIGLLLTTIGIWKMLLVLGLAALGFILGAFPGRAKAVKDQVKSMLTPKSTPNENNDSAKGE